jgi:hypothetical protein
MSHYILQAGGLGLEVCASTPGQPQIVYYQLICVQYLAEGK